MLRFLDPYVHAPSQLKYQLSLLEMIHPNYNSYRQTSQIIAQDRRAKEERICLIEVSFLQVVLEDLQRFLSRHRLLKEEFFFLDLPQEAPYGERSIKHL